MPEWPDVVLYLEKLDPLVKGRVLRKVRIAGPFLLRTVDPPVEAFEGRAIRELRRIGKRIVLGFEEGLFLVLHLMIAGRFHWGAPKAKIHGKIGLAAFDFDEGTLLLTEAGTKKRAALHAVRGEGGLRALDPGGVELFEVDEAAFREALTRENHTLKRALTDPRLLSGIGNAYSDEILHRAGLSPLQLTQKMKPADIQKLFKTTRRVLQECLDRVRKDAGGAFPSKVTAFRSWMAVHGRYKKPCPVCNSPVQRIVYAENETNYCATCQTGGKVLADRSLSRLLKDDWPRTIEELEGRG